MKLFKLYIIFLPFKYIQKRRFSAKKAVYLFLCVFFEISHYNNTVRRYIVRFLLFGTKNKYFISQIISYIILFIIFLSKHFTKNNPAGYPFLFLYYLTNETSQMFVVYFKI